MNKLEKQLSLLLKDLKENYNVIKIRAEFESEASRMVELSRLKDVVSSAGLTLMMNIGGVGAGTDIYNCLTIGAGGIVAPMVETAFAMSKYIKAIEKFVPEDNRKDMEFSAIIETITAYKNIDEILSTRGIDLLSIMTIGRNDFIASMGLDRNSANSKEMLKICRDIFKKLKAKGFKTGLGGAISPEAIPFLKQLNEENLIDEFETMKVVFKNSLINKNIKEGILKAVEFELLWLKTKKSYYSRVNIEDDIRIEMLETRLKN